MKVLIACQDKYEAQKLASLIYIKKGDETYIKKILNVIDSEVVISLKDKSAHSVLLRDAKNVEIFADFIQSIIESKHKISKVSTAGSVIEIVKLDK